MDQQLEVGGVRLRFRIEGEGPWLFLVHGVGGSLEQWDGFVRLLDGRFKTVRYDQRGHGQSEKVPGPYSIWDLVGDLENLRNELGAEEISLAGASLGALVAQGYALQHQQHLRSLALLAGVAGRTAEEQEKVLQRLKIVEKGIPGEHFANSVDRWFTEEFRVANPEAVAAYAKRNQSNDPACYAAAYKVLATTDFADRLPEIKIPTIIVTGEFDQGSNPRMAQLMHRLIPNSQVVIIPRLRHSLLIEAPDQVSNVVLPFLLETTEALRD